MSQVSSTFRMCMVLFCLLMCCWYLFQKDAASLAFYGFLMLFWQNMELHADR